MPNEFSFNTSLGDSFTFGPFWSTILQGTFATEPFEEQLFDLLTHNSSLTQFDAIEYKVWAKLGTKTLQWLTRKGAGVGIISVYLDGVFVGALDCYDAGVIWNFLASWPVTVMFTGEHIIKLVVEDRNPLAVNWVFYTTYLRIK